MDNANKNALEESENSSDEESEVETK
jgi:hypothetical protein